MNSDIFQFLDNLIIVFVRTHLLSELDKNNICNQLLSPRRVGVSRTGPRTDSAGYRRAAAAAPAAVGGYWTG